MNGREFIPSSSEFRLSVCLRIHAGCADMESHQIVEVTNCAITRYALRDGKEKTIKIESFSMDKLDVMQQQHIVLKALVNASCHPTFLSFPPASFPTTCLNSLLVGVLVRREKRELHDLQCEVRISYLKFWACKEYFIAILYSHADEDSYFIASHSAAAMQYSFLVT